MSTGDPQYTYQETLPCGCYVGVWMGVTPPPRCSQHSLENVAGRPPTLPIGEVWNGSVTSNLISNVPDSVHNIDGWFQKMGQLLGGELGKAIAKGEDGTAERDLWTMAMQNLEALRAAVDRARRGS